MIGIDVDFLDQVAQRDSQPGKPRRRLRQRRNIAGRLAADAVEQPAQLQAVDEPPRPGGIEGRQGQHDVAQDLGVDAAYADQQRRAELLVARHAEDHLDAGARHGRDQNAGTKARGEIVISSGDLLSRQPKPDAADLALVRDARSRALQHHGIAKRSCGGDGLSPRLGAAAGDHRYAAIGQKVE